MTKRHYCKNESSWTECGQAITYCWEDRDGRLWAGCGEYESQVSFCPVCGFKAVISCVGDFVDDGFYKDYEDFKFCVEGT